MDTRLLLGAVLLSLLASERAGADSATWNLNPGNGDWNTPANWTPATVPNGPEDIATFEFSNRPSLTLSASAEVGSLVFNPGAPNSSIRTKPSTTLTVSNTGVMNNSGRLQSFTTKVGGPGNLGQIFFTNSASAGSNTVFFNQGGTYPSGGTSFFNTATAGNGTFINYGGSLPDAGGMTQFFDSSTAGNGTFDNAVSGPFGRGGHTVFFDTSTAGQATIASESGADAFTFPGGVFFEDTSDAAESVITSAGSESFLFGTAAFATFEADSSAGKATIIANGGSVAGATTTFLGQSTAGSATLIANSISGQSFGGVIALQEFSTGGTSRIELFGIGLLDVSFRFTSEVAIGSLEGDGQVQLGATNLTVGSNNLSTTFAGVIDGSGSLIKGGRGRLILRGANTYTGGTLLKGGTLLVARLLASALGTGPVQVSKGTLGGNGRIDGPVTVGNGIDPASFLSPGLIGANPATLFLRLTLTFRSLAQYVVTLDSTSVTGNQVFARGVTIGSGALASFEDVGAGQIAVGTTFIIISNTSGSPIAGTFANLADGSSFALNGNKFLVSYEGGDGNDLTLTVVP